MLKLTRYIHSDIAVYVLHNLYKHKVYIPYICFLLCHVEKVDLKKLIYPYNNNKISFVQTIVRPDNTAITNNENCPEKIITIVQIQNYCLTT